MILLLSTGIKVEKVNGTPVPGPEVTSMGFAYDEEYITNVSYKVYGTTSMGGWYWDPGTWTADPGLQIWLSRYYTSVEIFIKYYDLTTDSWYYSSQCFSNSPHLTYCLVEIVAEEPVER